MKFTININAVIQGIAVILHYLAMATDFIPPDNHYRGMVISAAVLLQGISGLLAHFKNSDGTPQAEAKEAKLAPAPNK